MKHVAIIQARIGSTRLPGKVLLDIAGRPTLVHVLERVQAIVGVDAVVVATTTDVKDDPVAEMATKAGAAVFRGSEDDVLDRFYQAACRNGATAVVRVTADCPLLDPQVSSLVLRRYQEGDVDYVSNFFERRTFPDGLDTEVFGVAALERAWREARYRSEREHVTPYLWKHPELYRLAGVQSQEDLSMYRWTLDEPQDLEFMRALWRYLPSQGGCPGMTAVLEVLKRHPELLGINGRLESNAGYAKALREDEVVR